MRNTKKDYIDYLNTLYTYNEVLEKTEHFWAGNNKSRNQKARAKRMAREGMYGEVLKAYDPIAFEVDYNEWKNETT